MTARRGLVSWVLAGLLLAAALLVACSGGDGEGDDAGAEGGADARVLASGRLLAPPYDVTVDGAAVRVAGTTVISFARPALPDPVPVDESATLDVFSLVDLAGQVYLDAGGGDAGLAAAVARLEARAEVATVEVSNPEGIARLDVTDAAGDTATFMPEPPDTAGRDASDADREAAAQEMATQLRDHLAGDGGLVFGEAGALRFVPAEDIGPLLDATDDAFRHSGDARRDALLELYEDEGTVEELLAAYEPRRTARALPLPSGATTTHWGIADRTAVGAPSGGPQQGGELPMRTPGSPKAWVLFTLVAPDIQGFTDALVKEGYDVRIYNFFSQAQPAGSGWSAFLRTSESGAAYFATHSSPSGLSIQPFASREDAARADQALRALRTAGDLSWWREANGTWWLSVTPQGIRTHWKSADTIVHSASCYSITLAEAFNAREFFGYQPITNANTASQDTRRLWKRLTGEDGLGAFREASAAFAQGGFSGGFRHRDGSPAAGTVLSPSVVATGPGEPVPAGGQGFLFVRFDADMHRATPVAAVLSIEGCLRPIGPGQWEAANFLTMPVESTEPGEATVRVGGLTARSDRGLLALDGNQLPEGSNGVVENRDDYVFTVQCVASSLQTPTPGVQPDDGTAIRVADSSVAVPDGYVRLDVLVYGGAHYPLVQFITAGADACDADHYHASLARSLEGDSTPDPAPGECGFGRVQEATVITVDAPRALTDALPFRVGQ